MRKRRGIGMISSREQWIEKYVENDEHRELFNTYRYLGAILLLIGGLSVLRKWE
jgi:hypothetical protein